MKSRFWIVLLLLIAPLSGCGLIYGQLTKAGDGIKSFAVIQGDLASVKKGGELLVYAPFSKTDKAFYVARGEEAANFAAQLGKQGLFHAEYLFESDVDEVDKTAQNLRGMSSEAVQQYAGMDKAPRMILFGTLLERHESVAPTRGVLMDITYRLEFYEIATRKSTIIEVQVRHLAEESVKEVVKDLARRL